MRFPFCPPLPACLVLGGARRRGKRAKNARIVAKRAAKPSRHTFPEKAKTDFMMPLGCEMGRKRGTGRRSKPEGSAAAFPQDEGMQRARSIAGITILEDPGPLAPHPSAPRASHESCATCTFLFRRTHHDGDNCFFEGCGSGHFKELSRNLMEELME